MLSMVVLTGYVGQISLAQMSLAGIAAFFMARMMANGVDDDARTRSRSAVRGSRGRSPLRSAIAVAVAVGVSLGLPALRIRGVQLAVVTLAVAISLQTLYFENEALTDLSAGAPANVRPATFFGIDLASTATQGGLHEPTGVHHLRPRRPRLSVRVGVANLRRNGHRSPVPGRAGQRAGRGGRRRSTCRAPSCWPSASPPGSPASAA